MGVAQYECADDALDGNVMKNCAVKCAQRALNENNLTKNSLARRVCLKSSALLRYALVNGVLVLCVLAKGGVAWAGSGDANEANESSEFITKIIIEDILKMGNALSVEQKQKVLENAHQKIGLSNLQKVADMMTKVSPSESDWNKVSQKQKDSLKQEIISLFKPLITGEEVQKEPSISKITTQAVSGNTNEAVDVATRNQIDPRLVAIDSELSQLETKLDKLHRQANAGIASALAAASLPQPYRPGASMVGAGLGTHSGQSALAIGVSHLSHSGRWLFKVNGTANTRTKFGGGLSLGYHW